MREQDVVDLYDERYAQEYDRRFLLADYTCANTEFELGLIRSLLAPGALWLDIGCGTGYLLARFPEVERAGLDLSPAMLSVARERNPGTAFERGDFRDTRPEWQGRWSLVSCMWAAYSYVDTIGDVSRVLSNMIDWTAPGGAILLPIIDLPDFRNIDVTFKESTYFSGEVVINGVIWSWVDVDGETLHRNLIAPHVEQFVEWLRPHFEQVEVVRYPEILEGVVPRKAVIARGRRQAVAGQLAQVRWPSAAQKTGANPLRQWPLRDLLAEVGRRIRSKLIGGQMG